MKELSTEEKAKAYDEAIERYRAKRDFYGKEIHDFVEYLFPKLIESDDERIRKHLVYHFQNKTKEEWNGMPVKNILAWLEKQGEQKPTEWDDDAIAKLADEYEETLRKESNMSENMAHHCRLAFFLGAKEMLKKTQCEQKSADKAEPKFKSGDWIIGDKDNTVHQVKTAIENVSNGKYAYDLIDGGYISTSHESDYHLWTIQDAKEGDVLDFDCGVGIFKNLSTDGYNAHCYCYYDRNGQIETNDYSLYDIYEAEPATKEQRDQLEKAMADAGYTFDFEKKELKEIKQKTVQETEPFEAEHGKYYYCIKDYFCGGKKQASKGDVVQALRGLPIMGLKDASEYFLPVNFIKCNSAWSEEDEDRLDIIFERIERGLIVDKDDLDRLKSLRPQNTWKPSDEQMRALKDACDEHWEPDGLEPLYTLYQNLKKLREE